MPVSDKSSGKNQPRLRSRRSITIQGLKIRLVDDPAVSGVEIDQALRLLVRLMVRAHGHAGDQTAIIPGSQPSSTLTVSPNPRPDHDTNNEAA